MGLHLRGRPRGPRRTRPRRGDPLPAHRAVAGHLPRRPARPAARHPLRLPRRRPVGPRARHAVQPRQAPARPLRPGGLGRLHPRRRDLRLRPRRAVGAGPRGLRAPRAAQRRRRHLLRLGGRHAHAAPLARHGDLRGPRQGHDAAAPPGPRVAARHLRRPGQPRGHRLPQGPRGHGRRAAAHPRVRLRARPDRARRVELLGLQLHRLLRPPPRLRRHGRPRRAGGGVQEDGQGLPPGRPGGHPRRRLQPHRRGGAARPHAVLPRPRRPRLLQAGQAHRGRQDRGVDLRRHLLGRHRLRQHGQHRRPAGAAAHPRLAALLGHRDARRRLPLRPDVGADPHRLRHRHALRAAHRHRPGPDPAPREAHRRGVGRLDGRLPRGPDAPAVGGVERPVPRHHP